MANAPSLEELTRQYIAAKGGSSKDAQLAEKLLSSHVERSTISSKSASSFRSSKKNGAQIFGIMEYYQPCVRENPGNPKSPIKDNGRVVITVHNLDQTIVTAEYGKVMLDTELDTDAIIKKHPIQTIRGETDSERRGEKVLAIYVRESVPGGKDAVTGKYVDIDQRMIYRVVVVRDGDKLTLGTFNESTPTEVGSSNKPIQPGSFINAKGLTTRDWNGATFWNCGDVTPASVDSQEKHEQIMETQIDTNPRNAIKFIKIEEAPLTAEERKNRGAARQLSSDLIAFCAKPVPIMSWESQFDDEMDFAKEMNKPRSVIFRKPHFSTQTKDYQHTKEEQGQNKGYNYCDISFTQMCLVYTHDANGEVTTKRILLTVTLNQDQATQIIGIGNPDTAGQLLPNHIENLQFITFCKPDHEKTYKMDMNTEVSKEQGLKDFDFGVVLRTTKASFVKHNLFHYVYTDGIPVSFEYVKSVLGATNHYLKADEKERNFYNEHPEIGFVNLSELPGDITSFSENWSFRVLKNEPLNGAQLSALQDFATEKDRIKACEKSLSGTGRDKSDTLALGPYKAGKYVIFALRKDLVQAIEKNPDEYNMVNIMWRVKKACEKPVADAAAADASTINGNSNATASAGTKRGHDEIDTGDETGANHTRGEKDEPEEASGDTDEKSANKQRYDSDANSEDTDMP